MGILLEVPGDEENVAKEKRDVQLVPLWSLFLLLLIFFKPHSLKKVLYTESSIQLKIVGNLRSGRNELGC